MTFKGNIVISLIGRSIVLVLGVASNVMLARVLGPDGMGIFALCMLLPTTLLSFGNLGISRALIYFHGKDAYSDKNLEGSVVILCLFMTAILSIIGAVVVLVLHRNVFREVSLVYLFFIGASFPLRMMYTQYVIPMLLAQDRIKAYNAVEVMRSIVLILLLFCFCIIFPLRVFGALLAQVLSTFLLLGVSIAILFRLFAVKPSFHFKTRTIKSLASFGAQPYLGGVFGNLHLRADTFLVNYFLGPLSVGYYAIAVCLSEKLWLFSQTISTLLYPKLANTKTDAAKSLLTAKTTRNTLFVGILGSVVLFILSKRIIVLLFSSEYLPCVSIVKVLLVGITALTVDRILGNDLIARGRPTLNSSIIGSSLLLNLVLNIIMIPNYGLLGAALATSISYTVSSVVKIFFYCRLSGCRISEVLMVTPKDLRLYLTVFRKASFSG